MSADKEVSPRAKRVIAAIEWFLIGGILGFFVGRVWSLPF